MMNWQSVHYIFMPYGFRDTCSSAEKVRLGVRHAQRGWGDDDDEGDGGGGGGGGTRY